MNFHVEFTAASHADALQIIVVEEFLPASARTFLCQTLEPYHAACAIYVKAAAGQLYDRDYAASSAEIVVREIKLRHPKSGRCPGAIQLLAAMASGRLSARTLP